ncbi:MAG TPA: hypothetical protein VGC29_05470 [Flavisolibacter sp.]
MKKIAFFCLAVLSIVACKKEKDETYKVKYVVTGDAVSQFKFSTGATDNSAETPFNGTQDTTIYVAAGTLVKLDAKANSNNLVGSIYVNDAIVVNGTDNDTDGDGKTNVKLEYLLPK